MNSFKKEFEKLSQEEKLEFMKEIAMPAMCEMFSDNPQQVREEMESKCKELMEEHGMEMPQMMKMMGMNMPGMMGMNGMNGMKGKFK